MLKKNVIALIVVLILLVGFIHAKTEEVLGDITIDPNPMKESTVITLTFFQKAVVDVIIETEEGTVIKTIYSGTIDKGVYEFFWNRLSDEGEYVPEGQYALSVNLGYRYTSTKKTLILK